MRVVSYNWILNRYESLMYIDLHESHLEFLFIMDEVRFTMMNLNLF